MTASRVLLQCGPLLPVHTVHAAKDTLLPMHTVYTAEDTLLKVIERVQWHSPVI